MRRGVLSERALAFQARGQMESELRQAVASASGRADVRRAVDGIYTSLADAIEIRRPICKTSGRCCRFEEFGHRLYVTTMELAKFSGDLSVVRGQLSVVADESGAGHRLPILTTGSGPQAADQPGCPFQSGGLCGVHTLRPFGCRIFFCDQTSTAWQQELYERLHGQLRQLHDELRVPYFYVEWRFALRALGLASAILQKNR